MDFRIAIQQTPACLVLWQARKEIYLVWRGILCYNKIMNKTKLTLGWLLLVTGTLFLICGLVVMIFATMRVGPDGPMGGEIQDPSFWPSLANALMETIIELINIEWTPARAGVFLIVVGLILDGSGAYALITADKPVKRRGKR
jgi:hypothetical protein